MTDENVKNNSLKSDNNSDDKTVVSTKVTGADNKDSGAVNNAGSAIPDNVTDDAGSVKNQNETKPGKETVAGEPAKIVRDDKTGGQDRSTKPAKGVKEVRPDGKTSVDKSGKDIEDILARRKARDPRLVKDVKKTKPIEKAVTGRSVEDVMEARRNRRNAVNNPAKDIKDAKAVKSDKEVNSENGQTKVVRKAKTDDDTRSDDNDVKDNRLSKTKDVMEANASSNDISSDDINNDEDADKPRSFMENSMVKEIVSWVVVILMAVLSALFINGFIIVHANVPTGSMMDTIPEHSRVVGLKLSYMFSEPKRYDIVVFPYPDDETELFVKRIIGLPGETIEIKDGKVYVNGTDTPLDDNFIREPSHFSGGPYVIPNGHYFMMGDNRNNSKDSREWTNKYLAREKIMGKLYFSYYPNLKWIK